jgi:hypothetical protein
MCKIPGVDQIPAELLQTEGNKIRYEINEFIFFYSEKGRNGSTVEGINHCIYLREGL